MADGTPNLRFTHRDDEDAAELERLRRWKDEASPLLLDLQDLGRALDLPLGASVTGRAAVDAVNALRAEVDRLTSELERLRTSAFDWKRLTLRHQDVVGRLQSAAEVPDRDHLFDLLDSMNNAGQLPELCGFDKDTRPCLLWLDEEGGDSVVGRAVVLGGDSAEVSIPIPTDWDDLAYPLTVI